MNGSAKLVLDECIGRPIVQAIAALARFDPTHPVVRHILEFFPRGESDDVWIPRMAAEGYIIITADRGKRNYGAKLPRVCRECGAVHVLLSSAIQKQEQFEKARAILILWPELLQLAHAGPGSRFVMAHGPKLLPR